MIQCTGESNRSIASFPMKLITAIQTATSILKTSEEWQWPTNYLQEFTVVDVQITQRNIRIVVSLALFASVIVGGCSNSSSDDSNYPASISSGADTAGQTNVNYPNKPTSGTTTGSMSSSSVDNSGSTSGNTSSSSGRDTGANPSTNSGSKSPPNTSQDRSSSQAISSPSDTVPGTELVWRRKYYFKSSVYKACAFPDEIKPYKANAGTEAHELFYIRSKLNENSFLNNQIVDNNPYDYTVEPKRFNDHLANMTGNNSYYETLLSSAHSVKSVTRAKYTHSISEREFANRKNLIGVASFKIGWDIKNNGSNLEIFVKFIDRRTANESSGSVVRRGDKLVKVNNILVGNVNDSSKRQNLFDALFPVPALFLDPRNDMDKNTEVEFLFEDKDSKQLKKLSLKTLSGFFGKVNIGTIIAENQWINDGEQVFYLGINRLGKEIRGPGAFGPGISEAVYNKFKWYSKVSSDAAKKPDLILDLRYTETGEILFASQLAYLIAGKTATQNKRFGSYEYSSAKLKLSYTNNIVPFIGQCRKLYPCDTHYLRDGGMLGIIFYPLYNDVAADFKSRMKPVLNLERVFILTSEDTCGISEVLINSLLGIDFEVILIGTGTCGKPYYGDYYGSCGIKYFVPEFRFINDKKFGDYFDGFRPENSPYEKGISVKGCYVEEDLDQELGSRDENLVSAALQYSKDGTCPSLPSTPKQGASSEHFPLVW